VAEHSLLVADIAAADGASVSQQQAARQGRPNERRVSRLKGNDMTKMIDTEGDALPNNGPDDKYDNCWDINLWGDGELSLSIPMFFDAGDYNGAGVVTVGLRELLQEYLDDCDRLDGGEGLQPLAAMFREFADKYEVAAIDAWKEKTPAQIDAALNRVTANDTTKALARLCELWEILDRMFGGVK